jgi:hypothetical protein
MSVVLLESDEPVSSDTQPQMIGASLISSPRKGPGALPVVIGSRWLLPVSGVLLCFGVGLLFARLATGLKADEFELRVDALYETHEDLVVRLRLETTQRQHYVCWSSGIVHEWYAMPLPTRRTGHAEDERQGELFLFCSTVFAANEQRLKTILGNHRDHRTLRGGLEDSRLRVTIPSGRYPLNTALVVGQLDGRDV